MKRFIVEFGMGADLRGQDMTKSAIRAVEDALRHSSLAVFSTCGLDPEKMQITARVAVPKPDELDAAAIASVFPYGNATVEAVHGGLTVPIPGNTYTLAQVAIDVWVDPEMK